MNGPVNPVGPLPKPVVARCAATDGTYGGCHGATASGTNDLASTNITDSLHALSQDMRRARQVWLVRQAKQEMRDDD